MKANDIKYSKNIFAFLDILGFRSIVNESRINNELVRKIADILKRSQQIALSSMDLKPTVLEVDPSKYMYRAFSDTILISGPYTSHHDMSFISMWVMINQYYLWKEEQTFIRGAMVYGDVFIDKDIVFGPALIDAYDLERTKAVWPRVLIDKSLLGKFTETELKRDFLEFIRQDTRNVVYLDYLREIYHLFLVAESKRITGKTSESKAP